MAAFPSDPRLGLEEKGFSEAFPLAVGMDRDPIQVMAGNRSRDRAEAGIADQEPVFLQEEKPVGEPNLCLADFIAPKDSGITDYIGFFALTAGIGVEKQVAKFAVDNDDYNIIMFKILADRVAEGFAENLHKWVRKEYWGYHRDESLKVEQILAEKYQGIRPAPGYPACPEHSEKERIFKLLSPGNASISLTENFAMLPAASVCGYYFANPGSRYFNVGRISRDQVRDYAERKNMTVQQVEKLLATNLNYEPGERHAK